MGIGTSQGAYYDSSFHQQASKWQDGWDNNELDPEVNDTHTEDKNVAVPPSQAQPTTTEAQPIADTPKLGGKYLGDHPAEGTPEYDEWNRNWSGILPIPKDQSPEEFMKSRPADEEGSLLPWHKDPYAVEKGWKDKYMIIRKPLPPAESIPMSSNDGGLPVQQVGWKETLSRLQDKGLLTLHKPLQLDVLNSQLSNAGIGQGAARPPEGPSPFETFMATRGRRQESNIVDRPLEREVLPPVQRSADHPDFTRLVDEHYNALVAHSATQGNEAWQPRGIQPGESLRSFAEREVNRADPDLRYQGHRPEEPMHDPFEQVPFEEHGTSWNAIPEYIQRRSDEINKQFETQKVDKKGQISLVDDAKQIPYHGSHSFVFKNDEGVTGDLRLTERMNGKELYVNWIGAHGRDGPHDLGTTEMRNLKDILKDKFPNAEFISGFRVSGARVESGRGAAEARMRIRRPGDNGGPSLDK